MANKKISELPYVGYTGFTSVDLVPIVSYYSAATGTTSHTYISDIINYGYWTSGSIHRAETLSTDSFRRRDRQRTRCPPFPRDHTVVVEHRRRLEASAIEQNTPLHTF